jgi:hypothetical protein
MSPTILAKSAEVTQVTLRVEGTKVLILLGDGKYLLMPWEAAREFGKTLLAKAALAEEHAKHEQIVFDQALLQRKGLRFGLTSNPTLQRLAGHAAFWHRTLRRAIPSPGIGSQEQFGAPTLINQPPRPDQIRKEA